MTRRDVSRRELLRNGSLVTGGLWLSAQMPFPLAARAAKALAARGVTRVAECGPGKVLSGLIKRIDKSLDARTLSTPADFEAARETWAA